MKWLTDLLVKLDILLQKIMISPDISPITPEIHQSLIPQFCKLIAEYEGSSPTNRNHRDNNPGNIRCNSIMNHLATGKDADGFCIFPSWDIGMNALIEQVTNACTGKSKIYSPDMTVFQFISKRSPSEDYNDPKLYATWVCSHMNIPLGFKIKDLV